MNETLRQLHGRTSLRLFSGKPISQEDKAEILQAALQAPTAGNMALYSILDIQNPELKTILARYCDEQDFIADAPLVLLFLADYQKWARLFQEHDLDVCVNGPADLLLACDDALIAAQNAVVAAYSLGIDSCYIGDIIEHYPENRELLHLPDFVVPAAMVVFGYPAQGQEHRKKPPRFAIEDMVFTDMYPERTPEDLEYALIKKHGFSREQIPIFLKALHKRKLQADFHQEMNSSVQSMLEEWQKAGSSQSS